MIFEKYLSMGIETSSHSSDWHISIHNMGIHKYMYTKTPLLYTFVLLWLSFIETEELLYEEFMVAEL